MTNAHIPFAASFLLGKIHTGIVLILQSELPVTSKLQQIEELESVLRNDVNRLYYPNQA